MAVFDYFTDHEQDMLAEGAILEHEQRYALVGTCRACLEENRALDSDEFCERCDFRPVVRRALIPLLMPLQLTGDAQGN